MTNAIEIRGLCKSYGDFSLQNISLTLPCGSIMGLIGENGAGKTTTIKCILNLIRRDAGQITLLGQDNLSGETLAKADIGVVLDECYFHDTLRPGILTVSSPMSFPTGTALCLTRTWTNSNCLRENMSRNFPGA